MRIGHGYDAHRFIAGNGIVLGGVDIPFDKTFEAHSDGDVLIHALCDALLGALLVKQNYSVGNVDVTVVAQAPKLAPYFDNMRQHISEDLEIGVEYINLKATTTEGMGFTGRGEGVAVYAVTLLNETSD